MFELILFWNNFFFLPGLSAHRIKIVVNINIILFIYNNYIDTKLE